jgi:hypothetical protein
METKNCQNCKKDFIIESEDFDFYEKIKVPPPTFCPECRTLRRMSWHNERNLFRIKSAKSGKVIFSMFPESSNLNVWDREEWKSDDWDQNLSGREMYWNRNFFGQFAELMHEAPVPSRSIVRLVNSDYSNNGTNLKDCYLVFGSTDIENGAYLENTVRTKDSMDVSFVSESELSYDCFFNTKCYQALYSSFCKDSQDIYFCRDCVSCSDCFGCVGLNRKSYCIFNQQYSKEDYANKIKEFQIDSYSKREEWKKISRDFWLKYPVRYAKNYKNSDCAGEYITNSKNVKKSYQIDGGENLRYCFGVYVRPSKDSYDHYRHGNNSELIYECSLSGGDSSAIRFSYHVYENCREVEYSWNCIGSSYLFGCVGLHHKQYCILNKQYTKEEYFELLPKMRKHLDDIPYVDSTNNIYKYGEFFPAELAPVGYNQSVAMDYFPKNRGEVKDAGYKWGEAADRSYVPTIDASNLADNISDVDESILDEVIGCEHGRSCNHECTKVFRITHKELSFYKKLGIPIPHLCPNCRYFERIEQRSSPNFYDRSCQCAGANSSNGVYTNQSTHLHGAEACGEEFETTYAPERPEIVYCEKCYQQEVY